MRKKLLVLTALAVSIITYADAQSAATFEDFNIPSGNFWKGNFAIGDTLIKSGSYQFTNYSAVSWNFKYGSEFGVSKSTETSCGWAYTGDEFNNVTGKGANGSSQFAVGYVDDSYNRCRAYVSDTINGEYITGCYITNNSYVREAALGNDAYGGKFVAGDWLKLTATATLTDNTTKDKSILLIDFTSDSEAERTYLKDWTWFDFSSFGHKVKYVTFTITGSADHVGAYGLNTPKYFCMDDFGTATPAGINETSDANKSVSDIRYFTIDGKKLSNCQRGANIVVTRYSDGSMSTKKILLK